MLLPSFNQSANIILKKHGYATLKFVYDIRSTIISYTRPKINAMTEHFSISKCSNK